MKKYFILIIVILAILVGSTPMYGANSQIIQLKNGWNLVGTTVPILNINTLIPMADIVWSYQNSTWSVASPNGFYTQAITNSGLNLLSSLEVGSGFWVNIKDDTNITLITTPFLDTNTSQIKDSNFSSEIILHKNSFLNDTQNWKVSYAGACSLSFSNAENNGSDGSLLVSSRVHAYDGAFLNITSMIEPNKLYVIRAYIKQMENSSDNYQLMAKILSPTPQYILLNRIKVDNAQWNKLRTFVSFTREQIDSGVEIYINSDTNKNDYYLDEIEITHSAFTPTLSDDSEKILIIKNANIVDTNNSTVRLKGINLVAYGDNEGNEASTFMNYTYYNYDKNDFKNIKSLGFNSVRLALWYKYFEDDSNPYNYKESGFEWLNTIIGWAKEAGILVVLDMHAPQGGGFQGPNNITPFWDNIEYHNRFIALWKEIALRYKNVDTVAAYDLINEPCAYNQAEYIALIKKTIDEIRTIDSKHIINVEEGFSQDMQPFILSEYTNILYDFHFYDPWSFTSNATTLYDENGVNDASVEELFSQYADFYNGHAFHVSEFGQMRANINTKNSDLWIKKVFNLLNEYGASYHYWNYKGNSFGLYDGKNTFSENSNVSNELKDIFLNNNENNF